MYDMWAKNIFWLISGTSDGLDQWVGGISKERFHLSSIFLCKSGKAMPYINAPYRNPSFLSRVRAFLINVPIQETGDRVIDLAPWPKSISQDGVVKFEHSNRPEGVRMRDKIVKPDVLVFCTGYSQSFPFLDNSYPVPLQADRRGIYKSSDPSVGFIGFVRPGMGAIPALSELQAQHWTLSLLDLICSTPPRDIDYKLHMHPGRREYESYGVDHDAYAYQLALDMGSAPSFTQVAGFGFKTAFTWAMGPNFNTKFRLIGPWKWEGANEVMRGELWGVVKESGGWFCKFSVCCSILVSFTSYIDCENRSYDIYDNSFYVIWGSEHSFMDWVWRGGFGSWGSEVDKGEDEDQASAETSGLRMEKELRQS
jgi:dimethylaniline monooxygenase (N-oxide forming)